MQHNNILSDHVHNEISPQARDQTRDPPWMNFCDEIFLDSIYGDLHDLQWSKVFKTLKSEMVLILCEGGWNLVS